MAKFFQNPFVKGLSYLIFVLGSVGLILCGVNLDNVSSILTLVSGSVSTVGSVLIQIINGFKDKKPIAKG